MALLAKAELEQAVGRLWPVRLSVEEALQQFGRRLDFFQCFAGGDGIIALGLGRHEPENAIGQQVRRQRQVALPGVLRDRLQCLLRLLEFPFAIPHHRQAVAGDIHVCELGELVDDRLVALAGFAV